MYYTESDGNSYPAKKRIRAIDRVEAGTNGYQGGDSGHGSRTYLRLKDLGSTDIRCNVAADQFGCDSIEIILGGDAELETMKEALRWMLSVLETQSEMEA